VAAFPGLSIDSAGVGYRLSASATGLTAGSSGLFNITPGPATSFTILAGNNQFYPSNFGGPRTSMLVAVRDALGNGVPGVSVTFTGGANVTVNGAATAVVVT